MPAAFGANGRDGSAVRKGGGLSLADGLCGFEVIFTLRVGCAGVHGGDEVRKPVPFNIAAPVLLAERLADVDDKRRPVDRAPVRERDEARLGRNLLAAREVGRRLGIVVPFPGMLIAKEVPRVEEVDPADRVIRLPDGLDMAEAAEEGEVEVLDRVLEVLNAGDKCVHSLALRFGKALILLGGAGVHLPADAGDGRSAAVDARHERRVAVLDLGVDLLE